MKRWFLWSNFGYTELGCLYAAIIFVFGLAYFALVQWAPEHGPSISSATTSDELLNSFYFSVITATTVGYGDIVPQGLSKLLASIETIVAFLVFAMLISKLVSGRQERAVLQMHKLAVKDNATSIREGFYIMRRDFDTLMNDLESGAFSDRSLDDFVIALRHGEVLLKDIPGLYISDQQLYTPGPRRELLLAEAVQRTFERLELLTIELTRKVPHWRTSDAGTMFIELINAAQETLESWHGRALEGSMQTIKNIEKSLEHLKKDALS